jgi:hypothetical protein
MSDDLVRRINERLGGISTPEVFDGDNLSIVLCTAFEDDGEQNENGWTDAAIEGCEQTLQAIRDHYAPLADRIEELEAKLAKAIWELKRNNDALEVLRPVWAQGWTNDSNAAQASGAALAQLWNMLGVQDQTQAVAILAELKGEDRG